MNWNPQYFRSSENIAWVPLRYRTPPSASSKVLRQVPKVLVCHDMMGGYTKQDISPEGGADADIYRIYQWHLIDIFVYFSHNMISIPTPGWTNAAHRNGTQCLGTFILEWKEGTAASSDIFKDGPTAEEFAGKLVQIAAYFKVSNKECAGLCTTRRLRASRALF